MKRGVRGDFPWSYSPDGQINRLGDKPHGDRAVDYEKEKDADLQGKEYPVEVSRGLGRSPPLDHVRQPLEHQGEEEDEQEPAHEVAQGDGEDAYRVLLGPYPGDEGLMGLDRVDPQIQVQGQESAHRGSPQDASPRHEQTSHIYAGIGHEEPAQAGHHRCLDEPEEPPGEIIGAGDLLSALAKGCFLGKGKRYLNLLTIPA